MLAPPAVGLAARAIDDAVQFHAYDRGSSDVHRVLTACVWAAALDERMRGINGPDYLDELGHGDARGVLAGAYVVRNAVMHGMLPLATSGGLSFPLTFPLSIPMPAWLPWADVEAWGVLNSQRPQLVEGYALHFEGEPVTRVLAPLSEWAQACSGLYRTEQ